MRYALCAMPFVRSTDLVPLFFNPIMFTTDFLTIASLKASFHSLRATFISVMDDAGISPHVTDAITGHKAEGGMHGHYSQPSREALMAAVEKAVVPVVF